MTRLLAPDKVGCSERVLRVECIIRLRANPTHQHQHRET